MKPLSQTLDEPTVASLRRECAQGRFPGVAFEDAMKFLLSDGIIPRAGLPAGSFLKLEEWIRAIASSGPLTYTASELKNKTGEILEKVLGGQTVQILKHGRAVAEIRKPEQ